MLALPPLEQSGFYETAPSVERENKNVFDKMANGIVYMEMSGIDCHKSTMPGAEGVCEVSIKEPSW